MHTEIICFASGKDNEDVLGCEKQLCTLLSQLELDPPERTITTNNVKNIINAIKEASVESNAIFLCGDIEISKKVLKQYYKLRYNINEEYKNCLLRKGEEVTAEKISFPANAKVCFDRQSGIAAFSVRVFGKIFFVIPDDYASISKLADDCILPYFAEKKGKHLSRAKLKLFDANETQLSSVIKALKNKYPVRIIRYSTDGKVRLEISACAKNMAEADRVCNIAINEIRETFGNCIYEVGTRSLAEVTVDALKKSNLTVSTAESCTGGMLSETITSVSGASSVLEIGICAYSNRIKKDALGVSEDTINTYGAVSKETAAALAKGIYKLSGSKLGIGITGVAGPSKSEGKEVGTVYIAMFNGEKYWIRSINLPENESRDKIREYSCATALDLIRRYILVLPEVLDGYCDESKLTALLAQPEFNGFNDVEEEPIVINNDVIVDEVIKEAPVIEEVAEPVAFIAKK